ncbi:MAG: nuA3 HAT complex component nto1 [Bathelium mastoideum]|nr:MAG: nuA3 HAT complex component nto1 [Bathelium mastoideum]
MPDTPRRRSARGPGRPRVRPLPPGSAPPPKRRKYIPGGPGGGGRYIDDEGREIPISAFGAGGLSFTAPRRTRSAIHDIDDEEDDDDDLFSPAMVTRTASSTRPRRDRPPPRPRYSPAATAAAAVAQSDGYKPREERSWEEFHPDLDTEAEFMVFSAEEVDGVKGADTLPVTPGLRLKHPSEMVPVNGNSPIADESLLARQPSPQAKTETMDGSAGELPPSLSNGLLATPKRRPGRPPRRPESMLTGLGSPPLPKIIPLPAQNPKERLNLPKPSFRKVDTFSSFEQDSGVQVNYVDKTMANVGFQESEMFLKPEKTLIRIPEGSIEEDLDMATNLKSDGEGSVAGGAPSITRVEYDMDEQDDRWLDAYNAHRKEEQVEAIKPAIFEVTMTQIEKEWHALEKRIPKPNPKPPQTHRPRSSSAAAVNGEPSGPGEEQDTKCAICDDGDCENTNAIVFCDGCDLAVHQECYGVPFIPEGQWLCRKCQLIGRGTPTCIFCPNIDGAFKQTNSLRWSHLLCAIWIPEVTLGNTTFMEPVMDVEKVPRQRWKLTCYICQQKMGACIQCGNKNCYQAFHVTCARRAKLFLKMKSTHGGPANLDASVLRAFCDKHVPPEWRRDNDVDHATTEAKSFYRHTMKGRRWADSQQSALALTSAQPQPNAEAPEEGDEIAVAGTKRKRSNQPPKNVWRLPSGAPVVPHLVYNAVESSLQRFAIRKRKEYVAEACKYWTLKREARRGAALLKRLQLQMESFTSMEITRRNFAGMGAVGGPRLQRRIQFAEQLQKDMDQLRMLCEKVKERETEKLKDVEILKDIIDTVYFPIPPLLWPILEKAETLDPKGIFTDGFKSIQNKLEERFYTSVSGFSTDIGSVFKSVAGLGSVTDGMEAHEQLSNLPAPGTADHNSLNADEKEKKKLAKRIIKAIQGPLEDATKKEAELREKPFEKELKDLDALLSRGVSRRSSLLPQPGEPQADAGASQYVNPTKVNGILRGGEDVDADGDDEPMVNGMHPYEHQESPVEIVTMAAAGTATKVNGLRHFDSTASSHDENNDNEPRNKRLKKEHSFKSNGHAEPLTPPSSEKEKERQHREQEHDVDTKATDPTPSGPVEGGIPWYLVEFDPVGTTIHDERWTGPSVLRAMSDGGLSDIDDDTMNDLEGEQQVVRAQEEVEKRRLEDQERERVRKKRKEQRRKSRNKCW